jgi:hypothetical protein
MSVILSGLTRLTCFWISEVQGPDILAPELRNQKENPEHKAEIADG